MTALKTRLSCLLSLDKAIEAACNFFILFQI